MYKELLPFATIPEYDNSTKSSGMEWGKCGIDTEKSIKLFKHSIGNMSLLSWLIFRKK